MSKIIWQIRTALVLSRVVSLPIREAYCMVRQGYDDYRAEGYTPEEAVEIDTSYWGD